jgi:AcrR family transcriptional regulator
MRLMEQAGPGVFSLRAAGVSVNAAYRHFKNKSALMIAAAADGFQQLATQMIAAMDRASRQRSRERLSVAHCEAVALQGRSLDALVADRVLLADRRSGAEFKA